MAAFFIASGYGFRKRSIHKCIHQQLKSLLKPYAYTALFTLSLIHISAYCGRPSRALPRSTPYSWMACPKS